MHRFDGEAFFFFTSFISVVLYCFHLNPRWVLWARFRTHVSLMLIRRIRPNFDYFICREMHFTQFNYTLIIHWIYMFGNVCWCCLFFPHNPNECCKKNLPIPIKNIRAQRFILHCFGSHFCSTLSLCGLRNCDLQCH